MYPEELVKPMREELTQLGLQELRTPAEVDSVLGEGKGTVLLVVNSVCGCAAGAARPSVAVALSKGKKPQRMVTVFAGVDREATERARSYLKGIPPSSPAIALLRDGEVVGMIPRQKIEGRSAVVIGAELAQYLEEFCS